MANPEASVLRLADIDAENLRALLGRFGIILELSPPNKPIPGSFWGDDEAGLIENRLYARADTPLHSILHEAGHYLCVDAERRKHLDTHAHSDDAEESAVCYLQILLADELEQFGRARMLCDMDAWGYSFRLGSSRAWFERDAADALAWLIDHGVLHDRQKPVFRPRDAD